MVRFVASVSERSVKCTECPGVIVQGDLRYSWVYFIIFEGLSTKLRDDPFTEKLLGTISGTHLSNVYLHDAVKVFDLQFA